MAHRNLWALGRVLGVYRSVFKCVALVVSGAWLLGASAAFSQENLKPGIWVDPDGCEHWVMDDGAEGYMTPHLRRDGTPVCRGAGVCDIVETDLLFETGSNRISASGRNRLVSVFRTGRARAFIVTGHTDARGSDEINMALGQRRANAVAEIGRSIGAPIAEVVSYGERRPRASNRNEAGRRANRRVEILCLN